MAKYTHNDIKNLQKHGKTDWNRVKKQTERDIQQAALNDKDAPLLSDFELNKFKPISQMRNKLGL